MARRHQSGLWISARPLCDHSLSRSLCRYPRTPKKLEEVTQPSWTKALWASENYEKSKLLEVFGKRMAQPRTKHVESDVEFGYVNVSFSSMKVSRKGESVVLTALEFKTLKYFAQNPQRVISRDELLNEVWRYENYPCTRSVDNHMLKLRQELETNPSRPIHFRTVHGSGYKFTP